MNYFPETTIDTLGRLIKNQSLKIVMMKSELRRQEEIIEQQNREVEKLRLEVEYYKSRLKKWEDWSNPSDNWGCYT